MSTNVTLRQIPACQIDLIDKALRSQPGPRLAICRNVVEKNIAHMRTHLEAIVPSSGFRHLRTHIKTHKSSWAMRHMLESGVSKFKVSPNELELALNAGAQSIFVAYPLLQADAIRFANAIATHAKVQLFSQVGSLCHAQILAAAAREVGVKIDYMLDLDIGMHRTGAPAEIAVQLVRDVSQFPELQFAGLHAYDGHLEGGLTPDETLELARPGMDEVLSAVAKLRSAGHNVARVVVGGTPSFLADLKILTDELDEGVDVEVSPGTWIYWDTGYEQLIPGLFDYAAFIYAQIMDRPNANTLTLNLGFKRWGIDSGPIKVFSHPMLKFQSASEEHTVLSINGVSMDDPSLEIGQPVFFVPQHVCSTVNLWGHFVVIGLDGTVESIEQVDARNC